MKIAILGPITTKKYYGGVAVFDEEIATGFSENGWETVLITDQKEAEENKNGIPIRIVNIFTAKKVIKKEKPDVVLASLKYAMYWKNCGKNMVKVYFLHGFFNRSYYGKIKSEIGSWVQRLFTRKSNYVFANSFFTKMINDQFFGIKTDKVFHLGVTSEYSNTIRDKNIKKEKNTFLYVGRLVQAKGVGYIVEAMKLLQDKGIYYKTYIAGDGDDMIELKKYVNDYKLNIHYLGRISQKELVTYYEKSEIFISMNSSEPFGIVFPEAILAKCKIICPYTGGQVEYLVDYKNRISFVDEKSPKSIAEGAIKLLNQSSIENRENKNEDKLYKDFDYINVAKRMISFLEENSDEKK